MSPAVKVGLFATIVLVVLGGLILKVEDLNPFSDPGQVLFAEFDSVAGLDDKASVRIAGVRVGRVDGITLDGLDARVRILLETQVPLTEGTLAKIANLGLLGDKYVELQPGPEDRPLLEDGAVIPGYSPPSIDEAIAKLSSIGDSVQGITGSLAGGPGGGNLGRLIGNLEEVSAQIRDLVAANRAQIDSTVGNVEAVSAALARDLPLLMADARSVLGQMDQAIREVRGTVDESRPELAATMENLEALSRRAQVSVDNLNEITGRLADGEGTMGKLLTSDELHTSLVSTLDSVESGVEGLSNTLGRIERIQLDLGLESFYLEAQEEARSAFSLDIDPGGDQGRRYRVALVDSPSGKESLETERITVTRPDGTTETTTIETLKIEDEEVFTALFGFEPWRKSRAWIGIIENSGGVQVEYPFFDESFWVSLEAFDFDRRNDLDPHLRLSGRYYLSPNLYFVGGYDDPLASDRDSVFLGGGITWSDDELKYLLGSVPVP